MLLQGRGSIASGVAPRCLLYIGHLGGEVMALGESQLCIDTGSGVLGAETAVGGCSIGSLFLIFFFLYLFLQFLFPMVCVPYGGALSVGLERCGRVRR